VISFHDRSGHEADTAQRGMAAQLESEVALPLAGVQQSLLTQARL